MGYASQAKGEERQGRRQRRDDDNDDRVHKPESARRLPARCRDSRPQLLDTAAHHRRHVPGHAVAHAAVRHAALRGSLLQALPLLGVRRGLPVVHCAEGAQGQQPRRLRPVAVRRAQRRQPQAG